MYFCLFCGVAFEEKTVFNKKEGKKVILQKNEG